MKFIYTDGGEEESGLRRSRGDCAWRAIAVATGLPYEVVAELLDSVISTERKTGSRPTRSSRNTGIYKSTMARFMSLIGWTWVPTMFIGSGCKVHLRDGELPTHLGPLVVNLSLHYTCVIDGTIYDTHDCSRKGNRCVYGYWHKPVSS